MSFHPIKDKFRRDQALAPQIEVDWLESLAHMHNTLVGQGCEVEKNNRGPWIIRIAGPSTLDSNPPFAFKVVRKDVQTVYVYPGYAGYADNADTSLGDHDVTITETSELYVRLDIHTGTFEAVTASAAGTPQDDDRYTYYRIATVFVADGEIVYVLQHHLGDIYESKV